MLWLPLVVKWMCFPMLCVWIIFVKNLYLPQLPCEEPLSLRVPMLTPYPNGSKPSFFNLQSYKTKLQFIELASSTIPIQNHKPPLREPSQTEEANIQLEVVWKCYIELIYEQPIKINLVITLAPCNNEKNLLYHSKLWPKIKNHFIY